eukprot:3706210-Prymnesium_polylepis.1
MLRSWKITGLGTGDRKLGTAPEARSRRVAPSYSYRTRSPTVPKSPDRPQIDPRFVRPARCPPWNVPPDAADTCRRHVSPTQRRTHGPRVP